MSKILETVRFQASRIKHLERMVDILLSEYYDATQDPNLNADTKEAWCVKNWDRVASSAARIQQPNIREGTSG